MKAYWISVYEEVKNQENLKKYAEVVTPIIKSYGGIPLVRGGKHITYDGDDFFRTVIWEFPNYEKAVQCHNSKEYLDGWNIAKNEDFKNILLVDDLSDTGLTLNKSIDWLNQYQPIKLSLIHISEPTRLRRSRMPSSA